MQLHHAGLQERGGHHHQHPVDMVEQAPRQALVLHAVLRADHRQRRRRHRREVVQRRRRVLRLHRQDDDVVAVFAPLHFPRMRHRLKRDTDVGLRRAHQQPVGLHGGQVVAAGDRDDLVPRLVQATGDAAADPPGAVDDEPHRPSPSPAAPASSRGRGRHARPAPA